MNLKVLKSIIDECKKMRNCVHCGAFNGTVKKRQNATLKIVHEKFNVNKQDDMDDLLKSYEHTCTSNQEIAENIKDFVEDLDPLKVQQLFSRIVDEDIPLF